MKIREFIPADAERIVSWISNEREFRLWCADRYEHFPISADDIIEQYAESRKSGRFFPYTAEDEKGFPIGHFILRYPDDDMSVLRLGFVIIDNSKRGKGIGCELVKLAKNYASEVLHAHKLTLGVFENNIAARKCYVSSGFVPIGCSGKLTFFNEKWDCIELELVL